MVKGSASISTPDMNGKWDCQATSVVCDSLEEDDTESVKGFKKKLEVNLPLSGVQESI